MAAPQDLMARYCDGDATAFRELYQMLAPRLFGYLVKMTRDPAIAADLLQQTFIKLHRARAAYIRDADPIPWIYAIARRVFLDDDRAKRDVVELGESEIRREHTADPAAVATALAALAELPELQREAVVLIKLEGKSVAEAAEIAGVSEGAMRVRAHRGYEALRGRIRPVV